MIEYPRIFSLSTVGIRKHYNQDYLLHRVRTDFTGNNGIGKSLIADLFQLIFIGQKSKISFGTESFKNKDRHIHTIPYDTDDAYVFIHIEFKKNEFITIGTNIGNKRSRPLKSFWILNQAYNDIDKKDLETLSLNADQLSYSKDFLKDGHFLPISQLARHLKKNKKGFLKSFTDVEDKKEYYEFLYSNELLPINLAIDENMDAFAKVIQSFSKANSLDTESDKILKDFLFENSLDTLQSKYQSNKEKLEKLINEYNELDEEIHTIELKQEVLGDLKELQQLKNESQKKYLTAKYHINYFRYDKVATNCEDTFDKIKKETDFIGNLKKGVPKIEKQIGITKSEYDTYSNAQIFFINYKNLFNTRARKLESLNQLQKMKLPIIDQANLVEIDIDEYGDQIIIEKINKLNSALEKYGTIHNINEKTLSQRKIITEYKEKKTSELADLEALNRILSAGEDGSLIAQIIKNGRNLTVEEETVLFGLLKNVHLEKPNNPSKGTQFTKDSSLLKYDNIEDDKVNSGYWFKVGALRTFVPYSNEKQIFADTAKMKIAKEKKQNAIDEQIKSIKNELVEILKFEKGDVYNLSSVDELKNLNKNFKDFSLYESSKIAMSIAESLSTKILSDQKELAQSLQELEVLEKKIPIKITDEKIDNQLTSYIQKIAAKKSVYKELQNKLKNSKSTITQKEDNLTTLNELLTAKEKERDDLKKQYEDALTNFKKHFKLLNINDLKPTKLDSIDLDDLNKQHNKHKDNYINAYGKASSQFDTTKDDLEVKNQMDDQNYSFEVLELVLLGPKIKHTENLAPALKKSNQNRTKVMQAITQAMLRIFKLTKTKYKDFEKIVEDLNDFFSERLISDKYNFKIDFTPNETFKIDWMKNLQSSTQAAYSEGELQFSDSVESFVEKIFTETTSYNEKIKFSDLLDPKTYFDLSTRLLDKDGVDQTGSTGQSYTAIVLLGIGRLSIVQKEDRKGVKFLILEEVSNMDKGNFNTFPNIAKEFGYQMLTMTPEPYGSNENEGWYLHHLIEGYEDVNINYAMPSSYFKTNESREDLLDYLKNINKQ